MTNPIRLSKNSTSPSIFDTIRANNAAADLTGASITFRMREVNSSTLKIDNSVAVPNAVQGQVRYDWGTTDLDTEGEFRAWWRITFPTSKVQETSEFIVFVDAHAPGFAQTTGAIAERVKEHIPVAYNALVSDSRYGERLIQGRIDGIKFKLFSTIVDSVLEATVYDRYEQEYIGKLSTLALIPAAADYWSDRVVQESATGTNENVQYPDRIAHLWRLHERLLIEAQDMEPDFIFTVRKRGKFPKVSDHGIPLKTADPHKFFEEFAPDLPKNLPLNPFS